MRRVIVEVAESSEKTSADQSSTPQVFRVTVETGIIQFSSVAGNSKSGAVRSARSYSESGQHTDRILDTSKEALIWKWDKRAPLLIGCIATCCHFKFKV